ncbi:hypothetical protein [Vibrio sp. S9_S30]|uniref:hypothetical protein n=1 Tax=Vibrio sp. S9_S30 TaxID=2720226 RepID=UPI00406BF2B0
MRAMAKEEAMAKEVATGKEVAMAKEEAIVRKKRLKAAQENKINRGPKLLSDIYSESAFGANPTGEQH